MKILSLLLRISLLILPLMTSDAYATIKTYSGFQSMGLWDPETKIRLDVAVWYPTNRVPKTVRYDDWIISVSRLAPVLPGKFPLVIISHDASGSRFSHHTIATALARKGFIVATMTHKADNINNMDSIFTSRHLRYRIREITLLIDNMLSNTPLSPSIDPSQIAVIGIGPGGTAAILIGGGRLDGTGWRGYCASAGTADAYCSRWSRTRMNRFAAEIDSNESFRDKRVRAVVAIAPGYGMFFSTASLTDMSTPLLLIKAGLDFMNKAPRHADAIRNHLPRQPALETLPWADHAALMAPCTHHLSMALPEICTPVPKADRGKTHSFLMERMGRFLDAYLKE